MTPTERAILVVDGVPHRMQMRLDEVVVAGLRAGVDNAVLALQGKEGVDETSLLCRSQILDVLPAPHGDTPFSATTRSLANRGVSNLLERRTRSFSNERF